MQQQKFLCLAIGSVFLLNSCAITQQQIDKIGADYGTAVGCGAGAVIGGAIGYAVAGKEGVLGGSAIGLAAGCYAGHRWQKRMIALQEFAKAQQVVLEVETVVQPLDENSTETVKDDGSNLPQVGFVTQLNNSGMFDVDQSKLTQGGRVLLEKLVDTLLKTPAEGMTDLSQRKFLVVGHTDSTGTPQYNQVLSEARAKEVGLILQAKQINPANIYYQGAGASRPVADNTSFTGRIQNRRVEIVELTGEDALALRIAQEDRALRYAKFGTRTTTKAEVDLPEAPTKVAVAKSEPKANNRASEKPSDKAASKSKAEAKPATKPAVKVPAPANRQADPVVAQNTPAPASAPATQAATRPTTPPASVASLVDFAGQPARLGALPNLAAIMKPKQESFALIREAKANSLNLKSCAEDAPRIAGEVKNLASGASYKPKAHTLDYIPGFGNSVWASPVNGNLVWLYPVSVLKDDFEVGRHPTLEVVPDYEDGKRKPLPAVRSHAKVFEGDKEFLYRVYFEKGNSVNASCMDLVFDRTQTGVKKGLIFYTDASSELMYADYNPQRQANR